uniref:Myb/SANT-like DNA-binding domain-containing protein n=1 Tax=Poecilia formosa TaxID=48698 RepID=A0A096MB59_POEFO
MAAPGSSGDAAWGEDEEDGVHGGVKEAFRSKPRFSYTEVKLLLDEVKKNRHILLKKFNRGVSVDAKKQKWTEITDRINGLGENHRDPSQTRQIMKKWADLKCDGKRRLLALRGPNGSNLRKKRLGPVERMVHRILMMSPSRDMSPLSSPENEPETHPNNYNNHHNGCTRGVATHSGNGPAGKGVSSSSPACVGSGMKLRETPSGDQGEFGSCAFGRSCPVGSVHVFQINNPVERRLSDGMLLIANLTAGLNASQQTSHRILNQSRFEVRPPRTSGRGSDPSSRTPGPTRTRTRSPATSLRGAPLPPPPPLHRRRPGLSSQSLQQQRAGRLLLGSVSRSLEVLTRSVQLLVESQQEFVQESLQLQRDAVDVLRDFSETALRMLRHKTSSGPPG